MLLVDVRASSVAGAFVLLKKERGGIVPELQYVTRVPLDRRRGEYDAAAALDRSLAELTRRLGAEGGPVLHYAAGRARPDGVLVSIGAPWQQNRTRVERIEKGRSFIYTRAIERAALIRSARQAPDEHRIIQETASAVVLDGRNAARPYGRRARRADIVILSASVHERIAQTVERALRRGLHAHDILWRSSAAVQYEALRSLYPHEQNIVIVEAAGDAADLAVIRGGIFTDAFAAAGAAAPAPEDMPRVAFLLAEDAPALACARSAAGACYPNLPRDENPPLLVALAPGHLTDRIRTRGEGYGDTFLGLLALYAAQNDAARGKGA